MLTIFFVISLLLNLFLGYEVYVNAAVLTSIEAELTKTEQAVVSDVTGLIARIRALF